MRIRHALQTTLASVLLLATQLPAQPAASRTGSNRSGFDVLQYTFRIEFPDAGAPGTIRFVSTASVRRASSATVLPLDLVATMRVDSVQVNAGNVRFTRTGDSVGVTLPVGAGDSLSVSVFYHGRPTDGLIITGRYGGVMDRVW